MLKKMKNWLKRHKRTTWLITFLGSAAPLNITIRFTLTDSAFYIPSLLLRAFVILLAWEIANRVVDSIK